MTLVLLAVFLLSTSMLVRQFMDNSDGSDSYANALALASDKGKENPIVRQAPVQPPAEAAEIIQERMVWVPAAVEDEDPHMEALALTDLEALREVNGDVLGWIQIPDTKINYPLLQGTDNDYYLNHTWEGHNNSVGSIFLEWQNRADLTDYNTIIYGHNMKDGSMFAGLRRYAEKNYLENHPYVYLVTDAGVYRYEVFSAYVADIESEAYRLSFRQKETRDRFLEEVLACSTLETKIIPEKTDRILTLSTCSGAGYSTRWVIHARLKMVQVKESTLSQTA